MSPPGVSEVTQSKLNLLIKALDAGRLGHGLILYGESLKELRTVSETLSTHILEGANPESLEHHSNFYRIRPEGKMHLIGVEAMRDLIQQVNQGGYSGRNKVVILEEADRLNISAANAFLKTLEEPPEGTYLILLTTRPRQVLETLESRCMRLYISQGATLGVEHPLWQKWLTMYKSWLQESIAMKSPEDVLLKLFGLLASYEEVRGKVAKDTDYWSEQGEVDGVISERKVRLGLWQDLIAEGYQVLQPSYSGMSFLLKQLVQQGEEFITLLETNMQEAVALEQWLMNILSTNKKLKQVC